ncbi:MAG TPA: hypothetical protein VLW17_14330 [Thermoanaerobaculaceae bacterium]|nr:hypothetical protein [Thermoanaerobaculaceae bacterium]
MAKKVEYRKRVTITVTPDPDSSEPYCNVDQSVVHLEYGGEVTFRTAKGCGPLTVFFPTPPWAPAVFPGLKGRHESRVPGTRAGKTFKLLGPKHATKGPRHYPYAVYCQAHNCFAHGSMPRMIIGP